MKKIVACSSDLMDQSQFTNSMFCVAGLIKAPATSLSKVSLSEIENTSLFPNLTKKQGN